VPRSSVDVLLLEQARCEAGFTFRDLARVAHLDRTTVSAVFRGHRNSTAGRLAQLCKVLDIEFDNAVEYYRD
jgi:transcriptional regulator with XRE-family HTH domain